MKRGKRVGRFSATASVTEFLRSLWESADVGVADGNTSPWKEQGMEKERRKTRENTVSRPQGMCARCQWSERHPTKTEN